MMMMMMITNNSDKGGIRIKIRKKPHNKCLLRIANSGRLGWWGRGWYPTWRSCTNVIFQAMYCHRSVFKCGDVLTGLSFLMVKNWDTRKKIRPSRDLYVLVLLQKVVKLLEASSLHAELLQDKQPGNELYSFH